ncbi:aminotransferase class V-fold PLP-dependent enzyme, partial [Candidatus Parcubacteria bacterium]|nr:aminotransferase class V-fold PLP-dependent enzyme [Candidatus Parcubacteria bacterium]
FHTDAVQAVQYLPINLQQTKVDLLSLSAHKFYGPKGVGILYVRQGTKLARQQDGGGQEFGLRAGTENVAGIVGMAAALKKVAADRSDRVGPTVQLRDQLIKEVLRTVPNSRLTGHPQLRLPHIASFIIEGVEGEALLLMLDQAGIAASSGSACTSGLLEPSHVLTALGIPPEAAHGSLRFSLGKDTTAADVDYVLEKLPPIVERLRKMAPSVENL